MVCIQIDRLCVYVCVSLCVCVCVSRCMYLLYFPSFWIYIEVFHFLLIPEQRLSASHDTQQQAKPVMNCFAVRQQNIEADLLFVLCTSHYYVYDYNMFLWYMSVCLCEARLAYVYFRCGWTACRMKTWQRLYALACERVCYFPRKCSCFRNISGKNVDKLNIIHDVSQIIC